MASFLCISLTLGVMPVHPGSQSLRHQVSVDPRELFSARPPPMTPYKKRMNPYIRRMAEDMQLRNLAQPPSTLTPITSTIC